MDIERLTTELGGLSRDGLDWPDFAAAAEVAVAKAIDFDASCWHTVDPGTILLTSSVNHDVGCSGTWLAEYEFVKDDVNKWAFLAQSGRLAGAISHATHGDVSSSERFLAHTQAGFADELRVSFVDADGFWAAAGFLRHTDRPSFELRDVEILASLSSVVAEGARRTLISEAIATETGSAPAGPGVVTFGADGAVESMTEMARHWLERMVEEPAPPSPGDSQILEAVAARARMASEGDPLLSSTRARVRTADGIWLLLYGSALSDGRIVVVIQHAAPSEVAQLVALAYGLTPREIEVTKLCIQGADTRGIAAQLHLSSYTVQDHLKAIFEKTGVRSRGELVGHIFLGHYIPRWELVPDPPAGWFGYETVEAAAPVPARRA